MWEFGISSANWKRSTQRNEIYYNAKQNEMNTTEWNETKYTKVRKAIERNGDLLTPDNVYSTWNMFAAPLITNIRMEP
jgi:hypothetical protein